MKVSMLPYIGLVVGVPLLMVVVLGSAALPDGSARLPLLPRLIAAEFAFLLTAAAAAVGVMRQRAEGLRPGLAIVTAACVVLAIAFAALGVRLWPL
ncbi:MAG: hypothetical protein ACU85V_01845 [Gammaproteobacteria bacterium]